jgi:ATP-binding cassette subfamily F protein 3
VVPRRGQKIRFTFPNPPNSGRTLVRLSGVSFGYGETDILRDVNVELERGDKIAIVGANGAGKTTLLRVLAGQLAPREGRREDFPLTRMSYFAQHAAETLDGAATVLGAVEEVASPEWRPRLRTLLGSFLFQGDDVFKICRVLSGGERQRVALTRMLLLPTNLLLLDEPTHHLDLAGKEVLEEALAQYPGGVVVVTHDRSLMTRVATRVLEVNDGRVILYPGGYADYEAARIARAQSSPAGALAQVAVAAPAANRPKPAGAGAAKAAATPADRGAAKEARRGQQKREREAARVEKDIEKREARMKELEALLADPELYHDAGKSKALVGEYETLRAEVESLWQKLGDLG